MPPVARIALIRRSMGKGEVILRAYECLRLARVQPLGCICEDTPTIFVAPKSRIKAVIALHAAGFDLTTPI